MDVIIMFLFFNFHNITQLTHHIAEHFFIENARKYNSWHENPYVPPRSCSSRPPHMQFHDMFFSCIINGALFLVLIFLKIY